MAVSEILDVLPKVFFLRTTPPEVRADFARLAVSHNYPKGNILFHDGEPGSSLHIVLSGRVKISMIHEDGREIVLASMNSGGLCGLIAALDDGPHLGTAMTLTSARIATVQRDRFIAWLAGQPTLQQSVNAELALLLRATYRKVAEQALLPVKDRLLATLLEIGEAEGHSDGGDLIFPRPTQQELAERVGSTRVVVARALRALEEGGSVYADGTTFRLSLRALVSHGED